MKKNPFLSISLTAALAIFGISAAAEETKLEKVETMANKTADSVRQTYRSAKDKGCEMVNGKMECAGKKIKNSARNLKDKIETSAEEAKNKVD
jgi:hypothetical protein